jgi:hypothetical protein
MEKLIINSRMTLQFSTYLNHVGPQVEAGDSLLNLLSQIVPPSAKQLKLVDWHLLRILELMSLFLLPNLFAVIRVT